MRSRRSCSIRADRTLSREVPRIRRATIALVSSESLEHELAEIAIRVTSQRLFREAALERLGRSVHFDAAFFDALNPRVPVENGVWSGFDLTAINASARQWDQYAVDLARWRDAALDAGGVAVDTDVFSSRERSRLHYFTDFARPLGIKSCALVHLLVRGRLIAGVGLCRTGTSKRSFNDAETNLLRRVAAVLALGDAAHQLAPQVAPLAERRVVCVDERLSLRQREIVACVALGHTNAQIAKIVTLSPNTVRNSLAEIFRVIGVANRAELVRHAVLR